MSSSLSKYGVIDPPMVDRLRMALQAQEAFSKTFKAPAAFKSLNSRLKKSQSPMLVILQLLHQEPAIADCIGSFLGAWAPALKVVIAEKPELKDTEAMQNDITDASDNDDGKKYGRLDEVQVEASVEEEDDVEKAHYLTSEAFMRCVSIPSDAHDPVTALRVEMNATRARLVGTLLDLRAAQAEESEQHLHELMLRGFWNRGEEGDPNWLLLDYWLSRMELSAKFFGDKDALNNVRVVDSAGVEHMDESAAGELFGKMQQYAREKRTLSGEHRSRALKVREAFKKEVKEAENRREQLKIEARHKFALENEAAKERASATLANLNSNPGEDGVPPSKNAQPSHPSLLLPPAERREIIASKMKKVEERLRKVGAELAHRRREMGKEVTSLIENSKNVVPGAGDNSTLLSQEITEEQDRVEKRKAALESVREAFKSGTNTFYTKLAEKMANSAQASLEAIDQKFVESGVFDGDEQREMFEDLLWGVHEKKWRVENAENAKRKLCSDLTDDVESRITATNKELFTLELERIERLQDFKESKMVKSRPPRRGSPGKM